LPILSTGTSPQRVFCGPAHSKDCLGNRNCERLGGSSAPHCMSFVPFEAALANCDRGGPASRSVRWRRPICSSEFDCGAC
jgi:hypothetical protein